MSIGIRQNHRVESIDFARGLAAFGVMAYHLFYYEQIMDLMRISYYFVYAFFVISGFALYVRYRNHLASLEDIRLFAIARFRRIAPLFWCVTGLHLALVSWPSDPLFIIPLNASLAFGLANPGSNSLLLGGWSIGIEIVFYALTPFVIVFCRGSLNRLAAVAVTSIVLMIMFVNHQMAGEEKMTAELWAAYSQPVAFFGYFTAGCLIGEVYLQKRSLKGHFGAKVLLVLAIITFIAVPAESAPQMLHGWSGLTLMLATIATVSAVAFLPEPAGILLTVAQWFGRLSYSTYLLHPVLYTGIAQSKFETSTSRIVFTLTATIILGVFSYYKIERRFLNPIGMNKTSTTTS